MATRAEMVEKAATALWHRDRQEHGLTVRPNTTLSDVSGEQEYLSQARAALDAVLPQVSTVAELEGLPVNSLLLSSEGWTRRWSGIAFQRDRDWLFENAPVTVVWRP